MVWFQRRTRSSSIILGLALAFSASPGSAQDISCEPPAVPEYDTDGNAYCAEPNIDCPAGYPPVYAGGGDWDCVSAAEIRFAEGPQLSCPHGAVVWDDSAEDWVCEELSECEVCQRCDLYVEIAKMQCIDLGERKARTICGGARGITWRGLEVDASGRSCDTKSIQVGTRMIEVETNCTGPAIEQCVDGWMAAHPGESTGTSRSGTVGYKVGAKGGGKVFGIGVEVSGERSSSNSEGSTLSASWGSGKGFLDACSTASEGLTNSCADCGEVCY